MHPPLEKICDSIHDDFIAEKKKLLAEFKGYIPKRFFGGAVIQEGHPFVEIDLQGGIFLKRGT